MDLDAGLLLWRRRPAVAQRGVSGRGWQGEVVVVGAGFWRHRAPSGGLSVGEGDLLQVDGGLDGLEQQVSLLGVELKASLAGVTPATRLEGEGGLEGTKWLFSVSVCRSAVLD